MSHVAGTVSISWQGCEPKKAPLADYLNQFIFSSGPCEFDENLRFGNGEVSYPNARPTYDVDEDDLDEAPLAMLAEIADYLEGAGWLEITSIARSNVGEVTNQTVRIYTDKRVEFAETIKYRGRVKKRKEHWSPLIGFVNGEG